MPGKPRPEPLLRHPDPPDTAAPSGPAPAFAAGTVVLVTLNSPREKFWGAILDITPAGLGIRGVELNSLDDFARLIRAGEGASPAAVFFPMHRVERIEVDARSGDIPSLRERFEAKAGRDLGGLLELSSGAVAPEIAVGCSLSQAQRRLIQATMVAVADDVARAAELLDISEDELRSWLTR